MREGVSMGLCLLAALCADCLPLLVILTAALVVISRPKKTPTAPVMGTPWPYGSAVTDGPAVVYKLTPRQERRDAA